MSVSIFVSYEPDGSPPLPDKDNRPLNLHVSRLQCGEDVMQSVYEQANGQLRQPLTEYGLFWPEHKVWISPTSLLGHARVVSGAKLFLRPKKRHLTVRFLDGSSKAIQVDETKVVKEVVVELCSQMGLSHPEELSLVVSGDYAVQKHHPAAKTSMKRVGSGSPVNSHKTFSRRDSKSSTTIKEILSKDASTPPLSPGSRRKQRPASAKKAQYSTWTVRKVKKQISKKHQIRLDTPWLDPNKTLAEQEVTVTDELILMYRFYYNMDMKKDSLNVDMLFKQARATYLAGEILCSPNDMVRLSAILCQITKGNYSTHKYSPDFLTSLKNIIAPPKCKIKTIAKKITAEHTSLEGLSVQDAKCWFVKLWSSLELFGMEFLSCTNTDTKDKGLIGISKDRLLFLYHKKKKNVTWDADALSHWKNDSGKDCVSITFTHDGSTEVLNLSLPDYSGVLVDCLQGHRDLADSVPDLPTLTNTGYQFDDDLEAAISDFATQTKADAKIRRALHNLTYEDVYWASKIENPLLSEEELAQLQSSSWENPAFANMDQLMEERFQFLDFDEYTKEDATKTDDPLAPSSPDHSPSNTPSPTVRSHHLLNASPNPSPLLMSKQSGESSPQQTNGRPKRSSLQDSCLNGVQESSKLNVFRKISGHSRSGSSGSGGSATSLHSDSEPSLRGGKSASPNIFASRMDTGISLTDYKKKRPASYVT